MSKAKFVSRALLTSFMLGMAVPSAANEPSLIEAFNRANTPPAHATNFVSFSVDGCRFQKSLTNIGYCTKFGQGDGDRTVTTVIDFTEVEAIRASWYRGKFVLKFELDFGAPGTAALVVDRLLIGEEGALQRYSQRRSSALASADLQSGKTFSKCDGSESDLSKKADVTLFNHHEPENWKRLVSLAQQCRSPKSMLFVEE